MTALSLPRAACFTVATIRAIADALIDWRVVLACDLQSKSG